MRKTLLAAMAFFCLPAFGEWTVSHTKHEVTDNKFAFVNISKVQGKSEVCTLQFVKGELLFVKCRHLTGAAQGLYGKVNGVKMQIDGTVFFLTGVKLSGVHNAMLIATSAFPSDVPILQAIRDATSGEAKLSFPEPGGKRAVFDVPLDGAADAIAEVLGE